MSSKSTDFIEKSPYLNISSLRYLPRWVIYAIDVMLSVGAVFLTYEITSNAGVKFPEFLSFGLKLLVITVTNIVFMYVFKTFAGIIRHSAMVDIQKLLFACLFAAGFLVAANYTFFLFSGKKLFLTAVLVLNAGVTFIILLTFRLLTKQLFAVAQKIRKSQEKNRVLILGISDIPIATAAAILGNPNLPFEVVGFLTQRKDSRFAKIFGKPIYSKDQLAQADVKKADLQGVIVINEILGQGELEEWVNFLIEKNLTLYKAPTVEEIKQDVKNRSIINYRIEDLLNRKVIHIENDEITRRHRNREVLVTGGAGSIGSEIVNLVSLCKPSKVVVVDQAETPLHDLELRLRERFPDVPFVFVLADVSSRSRMESIFEENNFSMVYHAAAYKHVPIVENNPGEGVRVNICGTKNLAELAVKYRVNRFVMISTDKAVNPTNVMGATKRVAEIFVQALQRTENNTTKFITTRFGNVLGSNGSVIPLFKKQLEKGGPLTITHPEITRYFMTIPEACELVLQAGTMGKGGEIYVFDMGEPVKIVDLAHKMIKLAGLRPGQDIRITFTGLRPGEKLYEELLSDNAKTLPTHHEKIMISKDPASDFEEINRGVCQLIEFAAQRNSGAVVGLLKEVVPEFKSQNSFYEILDK